MGLSCPRRKLGTYLPNQMASDTLYDSSKHWWMGKRVQLSMRKKIVDLLLRSNCTNSLSASCVCLTNSTVLMQSVPILVKMERLLSPSPALWPPLHEKSVYAFHSQRLLTSLGVMPTKMLVQQIQRF